MEKLNIAEILKDCPKGMELDCTCADNVVFDKIIEYDQIKCVIGKSRDPFILDKYGRLLHICCPKCVIFPKGKTTWEGFQRPFKDGDVVVGKSNQPFIFKKLNNSDGCFSYCGIDSGRRFRLASNDWTFANSLRFATEEEKQKLFDAIKANGYKWNPETNTLEKLEKDKFDITTLKPFDKVLVRDNDRVWWSADIYSHHLGKDKPYQFKCIGAIVKQCIPFEGNEYLLGTTNDCNEYFKTWE